MTLTDDRKQVDAVDLCDGYEPDRVLVYETPNGRTEYEAVPFEQVREDTYDEFGPGFEATDAHVEAVRERTNVDG
jgi:hypothetical protein